jgi:YjbR
MRSHATVPDEVLAKLRLICLALPEAYEETAWVGTRWCVRKKNFAHVLMIADGWPPAYAKVAPAEGASCVMTFRSPLAELHAPSFESAPFFRPGWWPDIAGIVLDAATDWSEVQALVIESYRTLAPKKLLTLVV